MKEYKFSLTDGELKLLKEGFEEFLADQSPSPTQEMKSLAMKINLSKQTIDWIDRMLEQTTN